LAFLAGANSIFYGDKLLTTSNPQVEKDNALFIKLGISPEQCEDYSDEIHQAAIVQAISEQTQQ
ncbi:Biotin synthase, partial [Snodgrassella alvi SCGC AB-598-P14]